MNSSIAVYSSTGYLTRNKVVRKAGYYLRYMNIRNPGAVILNLVYKAPSRK